MIGWYIMQLRARWDRARYRRAFMLAIEAATERSEIWGYASRADGLRAIRALERLNGRQFNPFDRCLVSVVRGQGPKQHHLRVTALGR